MKKTRTKFTAAFKAQVAISDQGSPFTCKEYVEYLKSKHISISMDGKDRTPENIFIERFWRTIKYQHIYLNPANDGVTLFLGIAQWISRYNQKPQQGISRGLWNDSKWLPDSIKNTSKVV